MYSVVFSKFDDFLFKCFLMIVSVSDNLNLSKLAFESNEGFIFPASKAFKSAYSSVSSFRAGFEFNFFIEICFIRDFKSI